MTAPKLTPAQVRALLWLAERPGEWKKPVSPHLVGVEIMAALNDLVAHGLAERQYANWLHERSIFRATPAGLALAKEVG